MKKSHFKTESAYASKVQGDDKKEDNHDPAWHTYYRLYLL